MTVEQLRASLREKHGALAALKAKAFAAEGNDDDLKAWKAGLDEGERAEERMSLLEREEVLDKKAHASAPTPAAPERPTVPAVVAQKTMLPGQAFSLAAAAIIKSKETDEHPFKILEDDGYAGFAKIL